MMKNWSTEHTKEIKSWLDMILTANSKSLRLYGSIMSYGQGRCSSKATEKILRAKLLWDTTRKSLVGILFL